MNNSKVFFSYTREDSQFARQLATDLRDAGVDIWMDQLDIRAGSRWDIEVEKALLASQSLLVILTPDSINSHNVSDEISYALDEGKRVIPVLLKVCSVPLRIRRIQYADFTKKYEDGFDELLRSFQIEKKPVINPIPPVREEKIMLIDRPEKISAGREIKTEPINVPLAIFPNVYVSRKWLSDTVQQDIEISSEGLIIGRSDIIGRGSITSIFIKKYGQAWIGISCQESGNSRIVYVRGEDEYENNKIRKAITQIWKMNITETSISQNEVIQKPKTQKKKEINEKSLVEFTDIFYSFDRKENRGGGIVILIIYPRSIKFTNSTEKGRENFIVAGITAIEYLPAKGEYYTNYIKVTYNDSDSTPKTIYFQRFTLWGIIDTPTLTMFNSIQELIKQKKFVLVNKK